MKNDTAGKLVRRWHDQWQDFGRDGLLLQADYDARALSDLAERIRALLAEEREVCAAVADTVRMQCEASRDDAQQRDLPHAFEVAGVRAGAAGVIAGKIRARGGEREGEGQ